MLPCYIYGYMHICIVMYMQNVYVAICYFASVFNMIILAKITHYLIHSE